MQQHLASIVAMFVTLVQASDRGSKIDVYNFEMIPNNEFRTFQKGIVPDVVQPGDDGELQCAFTYRATHIEPPLGKESWTMTVKLTESGYFECTVQVESGQTSKVKMDFFRINVVGRKISRTTALKTNEDSLPLHQYREYHRRSFVLSDVDRFHGQLSFLSVECGEERQYLPRTDL